MADPDSATTPVAPLNLAGPPTTVNLTSTILNEVDEALSVYDRLKPFAQRDADQLHWYRRTYGKLLRQVERKTGPSPSPHLAALCVNSHAGKVLALVRAGARRGQYRPLRSIERRAKTLDCWSPMCEPVRAEWIVTPEGKARLIGKSGPRRTAISLILRDVLTVLGVNSEIDFAQRGGGGERGYIREITERMDQGYKYWSAPDVKNFYPSIRPGHLQGLPINDGLIRNVAFLNEETNIKVKFSVAEIDKIKETIRSKYPELVPSPHTLDVKSMVSITAQALRQGLVPGSPLSPLLASWFLSEAAKEAGLGDHLHVKSYVDDLAIGGKKRIAVETGVSKLAEYLSTHPAGPIFLHDAPVRNRKRFYALGYCLLYGKGYGKRSVHVKPVRQRTNRFKARLSAVLREAQTRGWCLFAAGLSYWRRWYGTQRAWTKVPNHSLTLSENITFIYICMFESGYPWQKWS